MRPIVEFVRQNGSRFRWTAAVVFCAALLPEYAVPVLCLCAYAASLRQTKPRALPAEKMLLVYMAWLAVGMLYSRALPSGFVILGEWLLFWPLLPLTRTAVDGRAKARAVSAAESASCRC